MAERIPDNLDIPQGPAPTYQYSDIADGYGYTTYYLSSQKDSGGTNYLIDSIQNYSSDIALVYNNQSADDTKTFDSSPFQSTRNLKGTVRFNWGAAALQGGAGQTYYFEIKLYHYDGSTATQLGSTFTSQTVNMTPSTVATPFNGYVTVSNNKTFAVGHQLRVTVRIVSTAGSGNYLEYGIDPQNRDGDKLKPSSDEDAVSKFTMKVPFKIEV